MNWKNVKQIFDAWGNHWLVADTPEGKTVRSHPVSYSGISKLGELCGVSQYYSSAERVYTETPVESVITCCATPYPEEPADFSPDGRPWSALWAEEREKALATVELYQS